MACAKDSVVYMVVMQYQGAVLSNNVHLYLHSSSPFSLSRRNSMIYILYNINEAVCFTQNLDWFN